MPLLFELQEPVPVQNAKMIGISSGLTIHHQDYGVS